MYVFRNRIMDSSYVNSKGKLASILIIREV